MTHKWTIGDRVWTYVRRRGDKPEPTQARVDAILCIPGYYPEEKYLLSIDGILCIRDDYTCSKIGIEDVAVVLRADAAGQRHQHHGSITYDD